MPPILVNMPLPPDKIPPSSPISTPLPQEAEQEEKEKSTCPACLNLNLIPSTPPLALILSSIRLRALHQNPCPTCSFLWQAVSEITADDTVHAEITYDHLWIDPGEHGDRLGKGPLIGHLVPDNKVDARAERVHLQFYTTFDDPPSPWPSIGQAYHISPHGLSPSCLTLMRSWVSTCTSSSGKHTKCPTPQDTPLPKRLIDISQSPPRLYLSEPESTGRYAALSHCWNGAVSICTLATNIESHLLGLPALPRTFADAVDVARALGLSYLWIDSLCIVQDSHADWTAQAERMADVYANAHVTISADAAGNSQAGFLESPSRDTPVFRSIPVSESESDRVVHVRKRGFLAEELPFHCWTSPSPQESGRSKLSTRGWVFQERILSPRTLHFARHEMAYECRSVCECECSATSARTLRTTSVIKHFLEASRVDVGAVWRRDIVPAYTGLDLTVQTDRLPALAGLADQIGRLRGNEYLAGSWRESLVLDMLWWGEGSKRTRLEGYAPTWSWASITGQVMYDDQYETALTDGAFSVEDIVTDDQGITTVGNARAAQLGRHWDNPRSKHLVPMFGGPPSLQLAVVWDCEEDSHFGSDERWANFLFVMFGTRGSKGPFGILLRSVAGGVDTFCRVGFITGYQKETRLRRWASDGWLNELQGVSSGASTSESEGINQTWEDWTAGVLESPMWRVRIV